MDFLDDDDSAAPEDEYESYLKDGPIKRKKTPPGELLILTG